MTMQPATAENQWHEDFSNVVALGRWLYDNGYLADVPAVFDYLGRPWHYEYEWSLYQEEASGKWKAKERVSQ